MKTIAVTFPDQDPTSGPVLVLDGVDGVDLAPHEAIDLALYMARWAERALGGADD